MNDNNANWLSPPPGKAMGCLPRRSKPGTLAPFVRDRVTVVPHGEWDAILEDRLAQDVDLNGRADVQKIKDQDGIGSCFPAGTLIRMKDGSEKPIEQIQVLDEVVTAEGRTGRVMQTMVRDHVGKVCRLCVNGSHHVRMTPEHPVLTSRGYVQAKELVKNDMVAFPHGTLVQKTDYRKQQDDIAVWRRVESVEYEDFAGPVFNLEVEGDHSYVAEGIGVHNCATESTSQAMEVIGVRCGFKWQELNPWSIYRVTSGGSDRGSNIDDNLEFARTVGVLPCSYFPRYGANGTVINKWNAKPPDGWEEVAAVNRIDEWWDMTTIDEVGTALLLGYPVVVGWSSHSEVMVDLLPGAKAVVANSWSTEWGDKGFHVEPLSKINWGYGAFAVRTILNRGIV